MMIQCRAINMEMTEAIENYIHKRMEPLVKYMAKFGDVPEAWAEVKRSTRHHKKGEVFNAELHLKLPNHNLRSEAEAVDLYAAIDIAKDTMKRQLTEYKDKVAGQYKMHKNVKKSRKA